MKEVNISVESKNGELTIREGKALELAHPSPISLNGTLEAPYQFLQGKIQNNDFTPGDCHLIIKKDVGHLQLVIFDRNPHSAINIVGKLTPDTMLERFCINTDQRWSVSEFLKFIKTMRFYFADKAAHAQLVLSLQRWSVRVERVINEHNDNLKQRCNKLPRVKMG
jgi:hypothetical protein